MKTSKFTEAQIAFALKQAELGTKVEEVCRKLGISEATFYNWKKKYGGVGPSELRRMRQLEEENAKLKRLVADLSLDKAMLQDVLFKKALKPSRKRALVDELRDRYRVSLTKACALFHMSRSLYGYRSVARDSSALLARIKEIAATRVHYGYRRVHVMLQREGWKDNHKRVYRLYRAEGLSLRHKRPKRNKSARLRQPKSIVTGINEIWSMDFVSDALFDGRRLRALTVVDNYTRESLAIEVGQSLKGEDVVQVLDAVVAQRGTPQTIKVDNGSEFISKAMDRWAYEHGVELDFSRPGTPTDNAKVESFNGRFRQECLNEHWFLSLEDARSKIADWRRYYNESRPHSALQWATPAEFARQARKSASTDDATTPEISTSGRY
ncbi:IS3 family transposase (plasmid) [Ralstonia syzygii subsp. celebesensis]|uniref:IS3 family transposase n=2 Tax=Ralstonia TaxID=48736 RepID=UPI000A30C1C1|nr:MULTISPECIES: IS3 family transposase [Ralstonia solanacearum species complex]QQV54378.1 IS3 family transposase [Ralstonia syzygii subsp. celebesensis]QQV54867.1 IS3 family transposase [Ralstonia syzygii subsp. celebesensis]QQV55215.1 IS3 family transposase [Ralstonia syzygii subsp. celebesensis]QQV57360.1 IS3 family transposase [Ralstonia syzygii subsp. celebesensis]QQV57386.1 IS3 family transposase [Ralstonia syzygii subsp. celebesensis]